MSTNTRVRLSPDQRRTQLLDLGVRLLATRSIDDLSIDLLAEEAGVSRGLLYHYFGNKHDFHEAVVRRAAADLIAQTAPPESGDALERLAASIGAYVDYVRANHEGYLSLVKGAASGNPDLRAVYEEARSALTDRIFTTPLAPGEPEIVPDTPTTRLLVRGWAAMNEEIVLAWVSDSTAGISNLAREELLALLTASLPALVAVAG